MPPVVCMRVDIIMPLVVCRRAHVLFTLFVFVYVFTQLAVYIIKVNNVEKI
jgi:hypothetical protein